MMVQSSELCLFLPLRSFGRDKWIKSEELTGAFLLPNSHRKSRSVSEGCSESIDHVQGFSGILGRRINKL